MQQGLRLLPLMGVPFVKAGDDLVGITLTALQESRVSLQAGDILVFAQKVVSKAEGRAVDLRSVVPTARAIEVAAMVQKDARGLSLVIVVGLFWYFNATMHGKALVATSHNRLAAQLVGINTMGILTFSFGLSAALGAIGGVRAGLV